MEMLEDLGMVIYNTGSRKVNCAIYKCPNCLQGFKARKNDIKNKQTTKCKNCSKLYKAEVAIRTHTKHGYTGHPIHNTWRGMLDRCYKLSCTRYADYGGKGITVCEEWRKDFIVFKDWALANGWEPGLQIDKDKLCNDLNILPKLYSPKTCLWVTPAENVKYRELYGG
jgi:DNA-directed RNA polymerase subunit RPC12/RpoP